MSVEISGRKAVFVLPKSLALPLLWGVVASFLFGCGAPSATVPSSVSALDANTQAAIVESVQISLSSKDCSAALSEVLPVFESSATNNTIRLATAASYGCYANIDLFKVVGDLESYSHIESLGGAGFFNFLASEFPAIANSTDNKAAQAASNGLDALMAAIRPSTLVVAADSFNSTSYNPESLLSTDRINDSNAYLPFIGMALLGALMNQYGAPTANHHKSQTLPWTTATAVTSDGCAFSAALLNFNDGLQFLSDRSTGSVKSAYDSITSFLGSGLDQGCALGCTLCASSVSCTSCPTTLRNKASCTSLTTDVNSCAAAGLTTFVNNTWAGPP